MSLPDEQFMRAAIAKAREGILCGQTPFGACIVQKGQIVSCCHNHVWQDTDITAHAEICAIREACRFLKTVDLGGCVIYSTCEPCPMCFSAIHWAGIQEIVYGADISDAKRAGFHELEISNAQMKEMGKSPVAVHGGVCREECVSLFAVWAQSSGKAY